MGGLGSLDAGALISDRGLLTKGLVVLGAVVVGFFVQGALHVEPATVALAGATVLLLWSKVDPHHALRDVEWTTLLFFVGLFILVEAIVQVGIIDAVAGVVIGLTGGSLPLATISLLWISAVLSAVVDNIPYTAAMIPIVQDLGNTMPVGPLWWALALGACLGGNATLVGASANVVVASLAERSGQPITFKRFLAYGLPVTLMSLLVATLYLWVRYLMCSLRKHDHHILIHPFRQVHPMLLRIRAVLPSLNEQEQKVGQYVLDHADAVVHLSMAELAQLSGSSDATVFRFCKKVFGSGLPGVQDPSGAGPRGVQSQQLMCRLAPETACSTLPARSLRPTSRRLEDTLSVLEPDQVAAGRRGAADAPAASISTARVGLRSRPWRWSTS